MFFFLKRSLEPLLTKLVSSLHEKKRRIELKFWVMMFVNLVNNRSKGWKPLKYVFFTVSVTFLQKGKIILKIQLKKTIEFSKNITSVLRDYCCC